MGERLQGDRGKIKSYVYLAIKGKRKVHMVIPYSTLQDNSTSSRQKNKKKLVYVVVL